MKFWIKIQTTLEVWGEAIKRWWDTHLCVISRTAARNIVMERDMLLEQIEELEDGMSEEIEKLTDETKYLKDELAYEHMRNKRLEDEIQNVRDRDYKNIYPGLQAEIRELKQVLQEKEDYIDKIMEGTKAYFCERCDHCGKDTEPCPHDEYMNFMTKYMTKDDEVPTETPSEDS